MTANDLRLLTLDFGRFHSALRIPHWIGFGHFKKVFRTCIQVYADAFDPSQYKRKKPSGLVIRAQVA